MRSSAVWTCVWLPTTALTRPSMYQPKRLLFGCGFRVKIHDHDRRLFADMLDGGQARRERAVNGRHKYSPLKIEHSDAHAAIGVADENSGSREFRQDNYEGAAVSVVPRDRE